MKEEISTRYSLLERALNTGDNEAWDKLHKLYHNFIYYILREMNVPVSDLDDVCQNVMCDLMKALESYDREKGKFRTWFRRVIKNIAIAHFRKNKALNTKHESFGEMQMQAQQGGYKESELETLIDKEWKKYITALAMERVSKSYTGEAIKVFEMTLEGASVAEISNATGVLENTVYTYRRRVKKSLLMEIQMIQYDLENEAVDDRT